MTISAGTWLDKQVSISKQYVYNRSSASSPEARSGSKSTDEASSTANKVSKMWGNILFLASVLLLQMIMLWMNVRPLRETLSSNVSRSLATYAAWTWLVKRLRRRCGYGRTYVARKLNHARNKGLGEGYFAVRTAFQQFQTLV
jgi:hypothetical protein